MVTEQDAVELIDLAEKLGIEVRLDGGWGVDALMGRQTRGHDDIDLFVRRQDGDKFVEALRQIGFREETRPFTTSSHTAWQDMRGRVVDLHLFEEDADGSYLFEGVSYPAETFGAVGHIAGREVRCIPPQEQVLFHLGYEHDENDVHDVHLLCERFNIPVPDEYKTKTQ